MLWQLELVLLCGPTSGVHGRIANVAVQKMPEFRLRWFLWYGPVWDRETAGLKQGGIISYWLYQPDFRMRVLYFDCSFRVLCRYSLAFLVQLPGRTASAAIGLLLHTPAEDFVWPLNPPNDMLAYFGARVLSTEMIRTPRYIYISVYIIPTQCSKNTVIVSPQSKKK